VEIIIIVTKDKLMIAVKAVIEQVGRSCTSYGETLVGGNFDRVNRNTDSAELLIVPKTSVSDQLPRGARDMRVRELRNKVAHPIKNRSMTTRWES